MLTSCRRMFAPKRSSTPQSRHSRRDAAVDRQNMELPITLLADHPLQLGNFTSAHLGTFKSALTDLRGSRPVLRGAEGETPSVYSPLSQDHWLGVVLSLHRTRRLLALHRGLEAVCYHGRRGRDCHA